MLFLKPDVRKIEKSFFTVRFVRLVIHRQCDLIFDLGANV